MTKRIALVVFTCIIFSFGIIGFTQNSGHVLASKAMPTGASVKSCDNGGASGSQCKPGHVTNTGCNANNPHGAGCPASGSTGPVCGNGNHVGNPHCVTPIVVVNTPVRIVSTPIRVNTPVRVSTPVQVSTPVIVVHNPPTPTVVTGKVALPTVAPVVPVVPKFTATTSNGLPYVPAPANYKNHGMIKRHTGVTRTYVTPRNGPVGSHLPNTPVSPHQPVSYNNSVSRPSSTNPVQFTPLLPQTGGGAIAKVKK